jgi:hypothetical protein
MRRRKGGIKEVREGWREGWSGMERVRDRRMEDSKVGDRVCAVAPLQSATHQNQIESLDER